MMSVALWGIWVSVYEKTLLLAALLDAIGLIVIGMAVFDVSKLLLEEEVYKKMMKTSRWRKKEVLF